MNWTQLNANQLNPSRLESTGLNSSHVGSTRPIALSSSHPSGDLSQGGTTRFGRRDSRLNYCARSNYQPTTTTTSAYHHITTFFPLPLHANLVCSPGHLSQPPPHIVLPRLLVPMIYAHVLSLGSELTSSSNRRVCLPPLLLSYPILQETLFPLIATYFAKHSD